MTGEGKELRRQVPRHGIDEGKVPILPATYTLVSPAPEGDEGEKAASLFDLHEKGFQLRCPEALPEGAILVVEVAYTPRLRPVGPLKRLKALGKVRWCRPLETPFGHEHYAAGIELLEGDAGASETAAKLAEIIGYAQEASFLF